MNRKTRLAVSATVGLLALGLVVSAFGASRRQQDSPARIGGGWTITTYDEHVSITLLKVSNPAPRGDLPPDAGKKYVGFDLILKNLAKSTYDDIPSDAAVVGCKNHTSSSDTGYGNSRTSLR